jgi:hypothetical protein
MPSPSDDRPIALVPRTLVDHLVPGRECGECVACCKVLEIDKPQLKKPANVLCSHCTGAGCGIYAIRPDICRTWHCLWRRIEAMPNFLRPDKLGVVFSLDQHDPPRIIFERAYIVARALDDEAALDKEPVKAALDMFADEGTVPVWISFRGSKRLYYPAEPFASAIVDPSKAATPDLADKALAWRKRYGVD